MPRNTSEITRRRILLGIGTGLTAGLAGCGGGGGGGGSAETATESTTPTDTATPTPTETMTATETATATPTPTGTARVRVAHMSPNAPNVDVYVDGTAVLEDVPFNTVSQYLEVPAGERQIEITPADDPETSVFTGGVQVAAETDYTVAAIGEVGEMGDQAFEPLILEDDNSDPGSGMARIQLVHASPDAPAVDVTLAENGDVIYDGVSYAESGSVTVPAGEYTLQIRGDTANNDGDIVANFQVSLSGGEIYTAFAAGYLSPDNEPADVGFTLSIAQETGRMMANTARIRVAHLSPNAPNVDIYVDDMAVLEDVPFGAVSQYFDLAGGDHSIEITAAGDPDTAVFDGEVTVDAGQTYTIAAIGEVGEMGDQAFAPLILQDDNSDPGDDMARLRVVHASPDAPAVDITVDAVDNTLFDGVGFGDAGYVTVPAGDYTVAIRGDTANNDGDVVANFEVSLNGGEVYTAFAAGYLSPDDEPADTVFDLVVTQDTARMSG